MKNRKKHLRSITIESVEYFWLVEEKGDREEMLYHPDPKYRTKVTVWRGRQKIFQEILNLASITPTNIIEIVKNMEI